jgi:hypothetical protein
VDRLIDVMSAVGFAYSETKWTYQSNDHYTSSSSSVREHHRSCLNHVDLNGVEASIKLLDNTTTDHRPLNASVPFGVKSRATIPMKRRNFKQIKRPAMEYALLSTCNWDAIHLINDVSASIDFLVSGTKVALDKVAPVETIEVKSGRHLYLKPNTLAAMASRDSAWAFCDKSRCRRLRNRASALVCRDWLVRNLAMILEAGISNTKALWSIANDAMGKARTSLPPIKVNGTKTTNDRAAAMAMNSYYVTKIDKLSEQMGGTPCLQHLLGRGEL